MEVAIEDDWGFYDIAVIRHDQVLDKEKCDGTFKPVCMLKRKHYTWEKGGRFDADK
jgi:hypothetical protein